MNDTLDIEAKVRAIAEARAAKPVLDIVESYLRRLGASHILITGLPMPNRTIDSLVHRFRWPDERNGGIERTALAANDPALMLGLSGSRPAIRSVASSEMANSELFGAIGEGARVMVVPVDALRPFQAMVMGAGRNLSTEAYDLASLEIVSSAAFRRLFELGVISDQRPGDLSTRERRVLELTALGKTAHEIADLLQISQRTVHAHLQNASAKLNASNKTHTVVEALRYGQIQI
ncbi:MULTISPECIES: helix-turn-helix transcriptional regulator [Pseudovibrio]|uniref:helix-turn-helix transcriptional regulator n=1 Tax=Stappiaceae TaxID=2821832 RepID=UPI002365C51F|nr:MULTISPECIES: LuxR C-terminal-related transcriptional regulator [Pseudovibrio]MDD7909187.1 LuxR C-terminal-related transcriptional regulator [Pseudovibrio exalbescens]MDX5595267.1 LuxR C-terminal-related transcriptional regulator [Pseudovibrio sp. SPO723]